MRMATAAGVTPEMRPACASVAGRMCSSFFLNFERQARHLPIIEICRQGHAFILRDAGDLFKLTPDVALVLHVDFHLLDDVRVEFGRLPHQLDHVGIAQLWAFQQLRRQGSLAQGVGAAPCQEVVDPGVGRDAAAREPADLCFNALPFVAEAPVGIFGYQTHLVALVPQPQVGVVLPQG